MSNEFSLDDMNKAIEAKYAPFYFRAGDDVYRIRQILRLPKSVRDVVTAELKVLESFNEDNMDEDLVLAGMERVVSFATDDDMGPRLIEILGHDLLRVQMLMELWIEATQAGEASPSPV